MNDTEELLDTLDFQTWARRQAWPPRMDRAEAADLMLERYIQHLRYVSEVQSGNYDDAA